MSELCHVCDLFKTALFGPQGDGDNSHLDDGHGNDLPRPTTTMADAPASISTRSRNRAGGTGLTAASKSKAKPVSQLSGGVAGGSGATATPSVASEAAAPRASAEAAAAAAAATAAATAATGAAATAEPPAEAAAAAKPVPKTKFSKRATRGMKAAPAYMSFDDVDVEDDDSDGELFIEDARDRGNSSAGNNPSTAYTVNAPSVYRAPSLAPPLASAPGVPTTDSGMHTAGEEGGDTYGASEDDTSRQTETTAAGVHESMSSHRAVAGDSSVEMFSSGAGVGGVGKGGLRLAADGRVASIPRDGSTLDSARPHGASESFHGYKGYPGYEPDTPVAQQLTQPGRSTPMSDHSLTINPGADVSDPRQKHRVDAAPTPSSARYPPLYPPPDDQDEPALDGGPALNQAGQEQMQQQQQQQHYHGEDDVGMDEVDAYAAEQQQQQMQRAISPSATTSMEMATGMRPPDPRSRAAQVQVTTKQQRDGLTGGGGGTSMSSGGGGRHYGSETGDNSSAYGAGGGGGGNHGPSSPSHSQSNSMTSSYRNIQHMPSEDGMGSVLGTLAGTEDSANEDLQWKRSALKKFHKVMVKGEGLRVVKHNRSGGSQMRIIRYDPEIKALVWNSKRYMKKAGSANVPIVGIKRVGREGNTVSVTAAGRGTIGFEPQRIRDAKILAEALRALVDKEERSAMWRG